MKTRIAAMSIAAYVLASCGTTSGPPSEVAPAEAEPTAQPQKKATSAGSQKCCVDYDDLRRLDGQRVVAEGIYKPVHVMKRMRPPSMTEEEFEAQQNEEYGEPSTVQLKLDTDIWLMLGVYYESEGARPDDEIARFKKQRVRITGTVHLRTPDQTIGEEIMQTMIGPYIEVESIEPVE
ncbi:MAG: hypothetical protein JRF63_00070 [Deltaproteobacteria bacterium]|nr:hypothetical protein [Deltaproteobacteria bacterium]